MGLEHRRQVGGEDRHRLVLPHPRPLERRGEATGAGGEFGVGETPLPVDHRGALRPDAGGALEEGDRREGDVIGRVGIEIPLEHIL